MEDDRTVYRPSQERGGARRQGGSKKKQFSTQAKARYVPTHA